MTVAIINILLNINVYSAYKIFAIKECSRDKTIYIKSITTINVCTETGIEAKTTLESMIAHLKRCRFIITNFETTILKYFVK